MRGKVRIRLATIVLAVGTGVLPAAGSAGVVSVALFHRPVIVVGANQSSNWSGYNQGTLEQNGKQFTAVSGTWRVPKATQHASGEAEYSSTWIGIGGGCVDANCQVTDSTLIQAGTEQDVGTDGKATYSAWYELIPETSTPITGFTVHAGDTMKVSISEDSPNSEMWTIAVLNATTGQTFSTDTPYPSSYATAEWIVETPVVIDDSGNVTIGPLPQLSRVRMSAAMTNGAAAKLVASEALQLVDSNTSEVLATPSDPNKKGVRFNDCTYATSCKAPK